MPIQDTITKWAKNSLIVQSFSGFDEYGSPQWASTTAASTYACIINNNQRMVRDQKGTLVVSPSQIYVASTVDTCPIKIEDKITLPDGSQPLIISIQFNDDFDGHPCYFEVFT